METFSRSGSPTTSLEKAADQLAKLLVEHLPLLPLQTQLQSHSQSPSTPVKTPASGPHVCDEPGCGEQFNRKYTLVERTKTHAGEKSHVCPVRTCKKCFSTSGNLSRHKRLHGVIQPLECPVDGCICTFASANKLDKHMKFHLGSPVHVCTIGTCGKTFSTTGNLNRHIKKHHPEAAHRPLPPPPQFERVMPSIPRPPLLMAQAPRFQAQAPADISSPRPPSSLTVGAPLVQSSTTLEIPPLAQPQYLSGWMDLSIPSGTLPPVQIHTPASCATKNGGVGEAAASVVRGVDYFQAVHKPLASSALMQLPPQQNQCVYSSAPHQQQPMMHGDYVHFDDMLAFHVPNDQL